MESVNKRHFLGTTFKDALSLKHYVTKHIFIIIYSWWMGGGMWVEGGSGVLRTPALHADSL